MGPFLSQRTVFITYFWSNLIGTNKNFENRGTSARYF